MRGEESRRYPHSILSHSIPLPLLRSWTLKIQLGGMGEAGELYGAPPAESGGGAQPKSNLVHCSLSVRSGDNNFNYIHEIHPTKFSAV